MCTNYTIHHTLCADSLTPQVARSYILAHSLWALETEEESTPVSTIRWRYCMPSQDNALNTDMGTAERQAAKRTKKSAFLYSPVEPESYTRPLYWLVSENVSYSRGGPGIRSCRNLKTICNLKNHYVQMASYLHAQYLSVVDVLFSERAIVTTDAKCAHCARESVSQVSGKERFDGACVVWARVYLWCDHMRACHIRHGWGRAGHLCSPAVCPVCCSCFAVWYLLW